MNLEEIKNKLLKEKEELEILILSLEKEGKDYLEEQVRSPDEEADKYEYKQEYHLQIESLGNRLEMVKKALKKIEEGRYGICESCGKEIETDRLHIDLAVTLCRECSLKT